MVMWNIDGAGGALWGRLWRWFLGPFTSQEVILVCFCSCGSIQDSRRGRERRKDASAERKTNEGVDLKMPEGTFAAPAARGCDGSNGRPVRYQSGTRPRPGTFWFHSFACLRGPPGTAELRSSSGYTDPGSDKPTNKLSSHSRRSGWMDATFRRGR